MTTDASEPMCQTCGQRGLHACPGATFPPMVPLDAAMFAKVCHLYEQRIVELDHQVYLQSNRAAQAEKRVEKLSHEVAMWREQADVTKKEAAAATEEARRLREKFL